MYFCEDTYLLRKVIQENKSVVLLYVKEGKIKIKKLVRGRKLYLLLYRQIARFFNYPELTGDTIVTK